VNPSSGNFVSLIQSIWIQTGKSHWHSVSCAVGDNIPISVNVVRLCCCDYNRGCLDLGNLGADQMVAEQIRGNCSIKFYSYNKLHPLSPMSCIKPVKTTKTQSWKHSRVTRCLSSCLRIVRWWVFRSGTVYLSLCTHAIYCQHDFILIPTLRIPLRPDQQWIASMREPMRMRLW